MKRLVDTPREREMRPTESRRIFMNSVGTEELDSCQLTLCPVADADNAVNQLSTVSF